MKKLSPEVEKCIDSVCALGCDFVTDCIQALKKGELRVEYESLDEEQRASMLRELQLIMSVYGDRYR